MNIKDLRFAIFCLTGIIFSVFIPYAQSSPLTRRRDGGGNLGGRRSYGIRSSYRGSSYNRTPERITQQRTKRDNDNPYTFNDELYDGLCDPSAGLYYDPNTRLCKMGLVPVYVSDGPSGWVRFWIAIGISGALIVGLACLICILCKTGICT